MAKETKIGNIIENVGYKPISNRCIIVTYAPKNLSDKVAKFFLNEFYVFQMCKNELALVPFGKWTWGLKKEAVLEISYDSIKSVAVAENGLNYHITIKTEKDELIFSVQQKELSDWRSAGILAYGGVFEQNWHKNNLDGTLKALKSLKG